MPVAIGGRNHLIDARMLFCEVDDNEVLFRISGGEDLLLRKRDSTSAWVVDLLGDGRYRQTMEVYHMGPSFPIIIVALVEENQTAMAEEDGRQSLPYSGC